MELGNFIALEDGITLDYSGQRTGEAMLFSKKH